MGRWVFPGAASFLQKRRVRLGAQTGGARLGASRGGGLARGLVRVRLWPSCPRTGTVCVCLGGAVHVYMCVGTCVTVDSCFHVCKLCVGATLQGTRVRLYPTHVCVYLFTWADLLRAVCVCVCVCPCVWLSMCGACDSYAFVCLCTCVCSSRMTVWIHMCLSQHVWG